MSDIRCGVCGEPYDAWGVRNGDMARWEAELFRKGAGCPCCEGEGPEGASTEEQEEIAVAHVRTRVIDTPWDDDVDCGVETLEPGYRRPKWAPPPPKVLWTCAGCEVQAVIRPEDDYFQSKVPVTWQGGQKVYYSYGHGPYTYSKLHDNEDADLEPPFTIAGEPYCPGCAVWCDACRDVPIFTRSDLYGGDPYAEGANLENPRSYYSSGVCMACYEEIRNEDEEQERSEIIERLVDRKAPREDLLDLSLDELQQFERDWEEPDEEDEE